MNIEVWKARMDKNGPYVILIIQIDGVYIEKNIYYDAKKIAEFETPAKAQAYLKSYAVLNNEVYEEYAAKGMTVLYVLEDVVLEYMDRQIDYVEEQGSTQ